MQESLGETPLAEETSLEKRLVEFPLTEAAPGTNLQKPDSEKRLGESPLAEISPVQSPDSHKALLLFGFTEFLVCAFFGFLNSWFRISGFLVSLPGLPGKHFWFICLLSSFRG